MLNLLACERPIPSWETGPQYQHPFQTKVELVVESTPQRSPIPTVQAARQLT